MNLTQIRNAIIEETGRTDKSVLALRLVRQAVMIAHEIDFFPRDRHSEVLTISPVGLNATHSLPMRWRKFQSLSLCTSTGVPLGQRFTVDDEDEEELYNPTFYQQFLYKVVGNQIHLSGPQEIAFVQAVYYRYPNLQSDTASTWITDRYPEAISDLAVSYLYRHIGDSEGYRDTVVLWQDPIAGHRQRILAENLLEEL